MSTELKLIESEYRQMLNKPVLQSGELSSASKIADPVGFTRTELLPIWQSAYDLTRTRGFIALAFTQLRSEMTEKLGIPVNFKRVVYFSDNRNLTRNLRDLFVINPEFTKVHSNRFVSMEGCASIENDTVGEVVGRCSAIEASFFAWNTVMDHPQFMCINLFGLSAFIYQHELKHLDGEDASFPGNGLMDFSDPDRRDWIGYEDTRQEIWNTIHGPSGHNLWKEWLVERGGKNIIVNRDGQYTRDFKRTTS